MGPLGPFTLPILTYHPLFAYPCQYYQLIPLIKLPDYQACSEYDPTFPNERKLQKYS